jgi:hypothetical protein
MTYFYRSLVSKSKACSKLEMLGRGASTLARKAAVMGQVGKAEEAKKVEARRSGETDGPRATEGRTCVPSHSTNSNLTTRRLSVQVSRLLMCDRHKVGLDMCRVC